VPIDVHVHGVASKPTGIRNVYWIRGYLNIILDILHPLLDWLYQVGILQEKKAAKARDAITFLSS